MSKTQAVTYNGRSFWALDGALEVWLVAFIDEGTLRGFERHGDWVKHLQRWRVVAVVGDLGLDLDDLDSTADMPEFLQTATHVTNALREFETLDRPDPARRLLLGATMIAGRRVIPTEPIARLGDAIVGLIDGTLPPAPEGTWWLFGTTSAETISMRSDAPPG